ncbi:MAG: hypothetical protein R2710_17965 [Acidimicrobiales bacterium]
MKSAAPSALPCSARSSTRRTAAGSTSPVSASGPALAAADESMGGALYASRQLPEALGQTVRSSAAVAFTDAFSTVALVVSVVAVVAAIATAVVISRTES